MCVLLSLFVNLFVCSFCLSVVAFLPNTETINFWSLPQ